MTSTELKYHVLLGVDKLFEGAAPGYNDLQISAILNRAQRRVFNKYRELFDKDEKIRKMLAPVTKRASLLEADIAPSISTTYAHTNGAYYSLPTDVAQLVEEYVTFIEEAGPPEVVSDPVIVFPITYDYYTKNYKNRYKKPYAELVWRMDAGFDPNNEMYYVELITDGENPIKDYVITYLKHPDEMVVDSTGANEVDCEIIETQFQEEIIAEAIKIIVAALNDEGYQVAAAERQF